MTTELELARAFMESHPEEAAASMEKLGAESARALLGELDARTIAPVITRMQPHAGAECLRHLPVALGGELLETMPRDHSALLLRRMRQETREALLGATSPQAASGLALLLQFPENTAGALMDPDVLCLPADVTVGDAIEYVRHSGARIAYYLYVTDRQSKLVGVINLRELIEAREDMLLQDVLHPHVEQLSVHADPLAMMAHPGWFEYYALPVVGDNGVLVGILRYKTLRAVAAENSTSQSLNPFDVSLALGELYWSTLGNFLQMLWAGKARERTETGETP
jgi:magnesium transporter